MLGFLIGFCFDKFLTNLDPSRTQSHKLHNVVMFSVLFLVLLLKSYQLMQSMNLSCLKSIYILIVFHINNSGSRTSCISQLVRVVWCLTIIIRVIVLSAINLANRVC